MKKVILFSIVAMSLAACGGDPKVEQAEEKKNDSLIQEKNDEASRKVDSLEKAMEALEMADSTHSH